MSLKRELREFMAEVREWMRQSTLAQSVYKDIMEQQRLQIDDLHRKLMARNLPEFQTYKLEDHLPSDEAYNALEDETLAGEILELEEEQQT